MGINCINHQKWGGLLKIYCFTHIFEGISRATWHPAGYTSSPVAYPGDLGFNGFQWIIEIIENGEVWF